MPRRPTPRSLLALLAGVLVAASMPPWGLWPAAFAGIALFLFATRDVEPRWARFRSGWLFGAGWLIPGMVWMWFLTAPGYLAASAIFAAYHGAAAMVPARGRWRWVAAPAAHTVAEALRFCFPFGGVPLASLAIGQSDGPLLGVARIGGAVLLTWVTLQLGAVIAAAVSNVIAQLVPVSVPHDDDIVVTTDEPASTSRASEPTAPTRDWLVAGVALALTLLSVGVAAAAPDGAANGDARTLRVAAIQGGGPQGTRAVDTDPREVLDRHLAATALLDERDDIDIVVWPENVIDVAAFADSAELAAVAEQARRLDATFLVGVTEDAPGNRFTNAQIVVTANGELTGRYDKVRRVPFGEYVPMRGLLEALGAPTDLVPRNAIAGDGPGYLDLPDGVRIGVVISWEVFFGGRGRDGVDHGGELVINPTNGSSYTWTVLQTQQVASSRLRAVETGRWVVQASPTGFSAFISPDGDVHDRTGVSEQAVLIRDVTLRSGTTWYVAIGDKPWVAAAGLAAIAATWCSGWRPRLSRSRASRSPDRR